MDAKVIGKIAQRLAGKDVLACEELADGSLNVINGRGQKRCYTREEYETLLVELGEGKKSARGVKGGRYAKP